MKRFLVSLALVALLTSVSVPPVKAGDGHTELPGVTAPPSDEQDGHTELPGFTALLVDGLNFALSIF